MSTIKTFLFLMIPWAIALVLSYLLIDIATAEFSNVSWVGNSGGQWSSGGAFSNISSVGQPGGISLSTNNNSANFAGFLNTFSLHSENNTDGDGLPNELDVDNDNDGTPDQNEVDGTGFLPDNTDVFTDLNVADTDGDGLFDRAEALVGTDPNNPLSVLRITSVKRSGNDIVISWLARSNKYYIVYANQTPTNQIFFTNNLSTVLASGSSVQPWFSMTNSYTDVGAATNNRKYYMISIP